MATNVTTELSDFGVENQVLTVIQSENLHFLMKLALVVLGLLGVVFNAINVAVFSRMKSKEPINITLLGMAVSDTMLCFTSGFISVMGLDAIQGWLFTRFKWNPLETVYLCFGFPHTYFARITIVHTALITIERCLCVVFPLKVKMIVTRNRAKAMVVIAFLLGGSVAIPNYAVNRLKWMYYPVLNTTIFGHALLPNFFVVNKWHTPMDVLFFFVFLYIVISVCTAILIINLKRKMNWRETATAGMATNDSSVKEKKIVKMVVILSSIFMICFLPNSVAFIFTSFVPEHTMKGDNVGLMITLNWVIYLLEDINASMNIFIYYSNSSNYKETFNKLFHIQPKKVKEKTNK